MATTAQGLVPPSSTDRRTMSRALLLAVIALAVLTFVAVAWPMRSTPNLAPSQPGGSTARQQAPGRTVPFGATNPSISGLDQSAEIARRYDIPALSEPGASLAWQQAPGRAVPFGATNPSITGLDHSGATSAFDPLAPYPQTR